MVAGASPSPFPRQPPFLSFFSAHVNSRLRIFSVFCHNAVMVSAVSSSFSADGLACLRGGRMVFAGLSLRLESGAAVVLLGPNGSGKSSLLRMLAGLLRPAAGRLCWQTTDGTTTVADNPEAHAGRLHYLGHHDALKPVLTVTENVRFWADLHNGNRKDSEGRTRYALESLGLWALRDHPCRLLSAGQKRRANLARLLAAPAPLWLLDEPATALDKSSIAVLESLLAHHRESGGMVVLSTHQDLVLPDAQILHLNHYAPRHHTPEHYDTTGWGP